MSARLSLSAFAVVMIVAGCSATTSQPATAPPTPPSTSPVQTVEPTESSAESTPAATRTAIKSVNWGDGRNTQGMSQGVPNPQDWYTAAFGPQTSEKILYLTFDDGPWPPYTDQVLSLLAKNNAKATFFVTGNQAQQHPDYLQRIVAGGHALGDHSMTHADLVGLNRAQIRSELASVQRIVGPALGACMRPPYGLIDTKVASVSADLNLMPILWTAHAQDWSPGSVAEMVTMLKAGTEPGAVILLHDSAGKERTISATKQMLPWWTAQGYRFETVPACRV
ncbi:MAG: polysaccharide deacetylase family protein [Actinobacteria bacterium]|nr:polysaccharide deacetylase family protein [Actinomycetota bacterium]